MDHDKDLVGKVVAVIGGDRRQVEIMRNFNVRGAHLVTYQTPPLSTRDRVSLGVEPEEALDLETAISAADITVLPVPTYLREYIIYAPLTNGQIEFSPREADILKPGSVVAISKLLPEIGKKLTQRNVSVCVMADDDIMQVHHAVPTAEGALKITIENTDYTVFGSNSLVIGFGRVAQSMARALRGLGSVVTVAARREEARVRAFAEGFAVIDLVEMPRRLADFDLIYNTVPASVMQEAELRQVKPDCLLVDLASPPGGVDHEAAKKLGVNAIWARGQASSAPRYAGWAQYQVIDRFIQDLSVEGNREPV